MFERFTDQSRRVVVLAQEEARSFNHDYIGTEHLLVGLRHVGPGAAAQALESMGITLDAVRTEIETLIGRGSVPPSGHIPFTSPAKKCLELSLREALELGHNYIGTGHLLLGLIREDNCVAAQILGRLGAGLDQLRARVIREIRDHPEVPGAPQLRPQRVQVSGTVQGLLDTIDERLSAIERHLGIAPLGPAELRRYDEQIASVRREKEGAVERQDFETAAALREKEKELLTGRARAADELTADQEAGDPAADQDNGDRGAATNESSGRPDELARSQAEAARLRALLHEHDIDPDDPGNPRAAAG
jgi:ATP-dependent Clp protease ATP-binding subunit ClpA